MILDLNGASLGQTLTDMKKQAGADFTVIFRDALGTLKGPNVQLSSVPYSRAIRIVAASYGLCLDPINSRNLIVRLCDASTRNQN